jgi:hypothetical protein
MLRPANDEAIPSSARKNSENLRVELPFQR